MTKKDYERAAEIVRQNVRPGAQAEAVCQAFIMLFVESPRFDVGRFIEACGLGLAHREGTAIGDEPTTYTVKGRGGKGMVQ